MLMHSFYTNCYPHCLPNELFHVIIIPGKLIGFSVLQKWIQLSIIFTHVNDMERNIFAELYLYIRFASRFEDFHR